MKNQKDFIKKATSNKNLDFRLYFNKKYQNKDIHKWYQKNIKIRSFFDILDVGCGTGAQSNFFSKKINKKGNLYAFDKSNISVINLKKKITGKNKKVFVADMNRFDQINQKYFQKIKFDLINSVYSIYYAKKPLQLISKLIAKLKKGGQLVIFLPMKPNKVAELAAKFYKLPDKVMQSLEFYKKIKYFYIKKNFSYKIKYFRSKLKIDNINDLIMFYKSTTFYNVKYEKKIYEFLKKKYSKKFFIFKKDSCLITLTR
jgi:SAM-dependent methyltransferase